MVIPIKLLPYLMIIGGIGCIFSGDAAWGLFVIAGGAAWLYFRYKKKQSVDHNTQTNNYNPANNSTNYPTNNPAKPTGQYNFCQECGTALDSNTGICPKCGWNPNK